MSEAFEFLQGTEHNSEQHVEGNSARGADSGLLKKRVPPEQAKRAVKKRKLQSDAAEGPEAVQAAWSTLAEGAGLLVITLKTAGNPMHACCLNLLTTSAHVLGCCAM